MKGFYRIWAGDAIADIGTAAYLFLVPILAVVFFKVSDSELGVVMAIMTAAPGLLAMPLGALADKSSKGTALQSANFLRAFLTLILIVLLALGKLSLWTLVAIVFCIEALSLFYDLLMFSLVPRIVKADDLTRANSLTETGRSVTAPAGQVTGAFLYGHFGAIWVLTLNAVSYLVSSLGVWLMSKTVPGGWKRINREEDALGDGAADGTAGIAAEHGEAVGAHSEPPQNTLPHDVLDLGDQIKTQAAIQPSWLTQFFKDMGQNVRLWCRMPIVVSITLSAMMFNVAIAVMVTLLTPYALENVGLSVTALGFLQVPAVLLGLLGPVCVPNMQKVLGSWGTLVASLIGAILSMLMIWVAAYIPGWTGGVVLAGGIALLDFSALVSLVVSTSYQQKVVPEERQAGMAGLVRTITWGVDPLSALGAGWLSTYLLGRQMTIGLTVLFLALGILVLFSARRHWKA